MHSLFARQQDLFFVNNCTAMKNVMKSCVHKVNELKTAFLSGLRLKTIKPHVCP